MSGLAGWIAFDRPPASARRTIETMARAIRNRGPAATEIRPGQNAALGWNKSRRHAGAAMQMSDDRGTLVAMLDGQIANADALAAELGCPADPIAVLCAGYRRWGIETPGRLRGGLAAAVWDEAAGRLLLIRDRIGVKPLCYHIGPNGFLFASDARAIMASGLYDPAIDADAIPILLQPRLTLADETPLKDVRQLRPGHMLTLDRARAREHCYWRLESRDHPDNWETTRETVRALLASSVAEAVYGETDRHAMLSGGIDSTSVAALAADAELATYCLRFTSSDEPFAASDLRPDVDAPFAAQAAKALGADHHDIAVAPDALIAAIPAARAARDLPGWGQFDASMHILFAAMAQATDLALSGEAADEYFGGYPYFFDPALQARDGFPWLGNGPSLAEALAEEVRASADPGEAERARYAQLLAEVPRLPGEGETAARLREIFYLGMQGPLAVVLDRKDRMSSAHGIEIRLPFCDHRLVEYLWNVPWEMKARGGVKGLLKAAVADIVPAATLDRRKSAYPHIQSRAYDALLVEQARAIAADPADPVAALFAPEALETLIASLEAAAAGGKRFPGGANPAYMLVHIVELSDWIGRYGVTL